MIHLLHHVHCIRDARVQDETQASQPGEKAEVHPPRTTVHLQHDTHPRLFLAWGTMEFITNFFNSSVSIPPFSFVIKVTGHKHTSAHPNCSRMQGIWSVTLYWSFIASFVFALLWNWRWGGMGSTKALLPVIMVMVRELLNVACPTWETWDHTGSPQNGRHGSVCSHQETSMSCWSWQCWSAAPWGCRSCLW